jgi:endonuclease/exonuclease/phosphatase (EEP) superfamily protein YafD
VESDIFRQHWRGFQDCHAEAGWGFGFTKWTRRIGVRIDHALVGPGLLCLEARTVSGMDGDHSPVVVLIGARNGPSDD